jgi:signal transduction histidine kinase
MVCTKAGGLDRLDPATETFTHFRHQAGNPRSLSVDDVNCAYQDRDGSLWVGTNYGLDRLDDPSGTFTHYRHDPQDPDSLSNDGVTSVFEDRRGNLWIGTTRGLIINKSGEHLLSLINNVLDMAKIDAGRTEFQSAPFDLSELVRSVVDLMRVRAEEKGLELSLEQSPGIAVYVWGDAEKLRQVLLNLVSNAVKYTEQGSVTVRLEVARIEGSQLQVKVQVQDTGAGISQEDQEHIFDPFVQVGQAFQAEGHGTRARDHEEIRRSDGWEYSGGE